MTAPSTTLGTSGGNKAMTAIYVGTAGGAKKVTGAFIGASDGTPKLVFGSGGPATPELVLTPASFSRSGSVGSGSAAVALTGTLTGASATRFTWHISGGDGSSTSPSDFGSSTTALVYFTRSAGLHYATVFITAHMADGSTVDSNRETYQWTFS